MEATQGILEKVLKVMISLIAIMGTISAVLFMILHINTFPTDIIFIKREVTLSICISIVYILALKFDVKYFKTIALLGLIISMFNLVGFKILIKLLRV